jgi:hypothetical protein
MEALGKRVRGFRPTWYEVVGVSGDERDHGLNQPPTAMVYWPMLNEIYRPTTISYVVRSGRVGARGFLGDLQQAVWSVNPNLPLASVLTLEEIQAGSLAQTSFAMVMLAIAAVVSLLLGVVGSYGVIAYLAMQRTREIGRCPAAVSPSRDAVDRCRDCARCLSDESAVVIRSSGLANAP